MSSIHHSLIKFRNALGYKTEEAGICTLYAEMALNAFLVGDLEVFKRRCTYIHDQMNQSYFLELIEKMKIYGFAQKEHYSPWELNELPSLLDAMAFIDSGELYFNPELYPNLFNRVLSQVSSEEISLVSQSKNLEKLGGRALVHSSVGIYSIEELKYYLNHLTELAQNVKQDFAVSLKSDDHSMVLIYSNSEESWQLINANKPQLKPLALREPEVPFVLAKQILEGFNDSAHTAFESIIWTTHSRVSHFQVFMDSFHTSDEYKRLHEVTSHLALRNERGFSLVHLAARNHLKTLKALIKLHQEEGIEAIDLNEEGANGFTPLGLAAYFGHLAAVNALILAQDKQGHFIIDINKTNAAGVTPLLFAIEKNYLEVASALISTRDQGNNLRVNIKQADFYGRTPFFLALENNSLEAVNLLLSVHDPQGNPLINPNQANAEGLTPLLLAARDGQIEIVKALLKHGANENVPFTCSVDFLRQSTAEENNDIKARVNQVIADKKITGDEVSISPVELAWIMGQEKVVDLLLSKSKVLDKIKSAILTFEKKITFLPKSEIPNTHIFLDVLKSSLNNFENNIKQNPPAKISFFTQIFQECCARELKIIEEQGLDKKPFLGDAAHNLLIAVMNSLNHILSCFGKIWTWDNSFTYFELSDYSSAELRVAIEEIKPHVTNVQLTSQVAHELGGAITACYKKKYLEQNFSSPPDNLDEDRDFNGEVTIS